MSNMLIQDTNILEKLSEKDLTTFYSICKRKHVKKNEALFHEGTEATTLYIVLEGQVKLRNINASGFEQILTIAGPKDFIGIAFLKESEIYRADAIAREDAYICPIMRNQFLELSVRVPAFVINYSRLLTEQLFECRSILNLNNAPVKVRVAQVLCNQAKAQGTEISEGVMELNNSLTHDELASIVSATRSSVSLAIGELRDEGVIEGTRGKYKVNLLQVEILNNKLD